MTGPMIDLERGERRVERPALVEALAQRVVALESERDELVEALRNLLEVVEVSTNRCEGKWARNARRLLAKHQPKDAKP